MDTKRKALFGVIGTQIGVLSPQQIARLGVDETVTDLGETLVQRGDLTPAQRAMVEHMIDGALTATGGDFDATLDSLGGADTLVGTFGGNAAAFDATLAGDLGSLEDAPPLEDVFSITQEHIGRYSTDVEGPGESGRELGRGGIGRVVIAEDRHLGREIALKELLPGKDVSLDAATRSLSTPVVRFLREARITGQLEHPNIIPVYELGKRRDGTLYYTMKIVRGETLKDHITAADGLRERLKLLPHFVKVCQAIAFAHSRGVVHRDLKPGNVMLGEFGEAVVLDWGLAKAQGVSDIREADLEQDLEKIKAVEDSVDLEQTREGQMIGTPLYMSPEQANGRIREIDAASDVWSLGAILYEILTGEQAFRTESIFQVIVNVSKGIYPPVLEACPEAPPELAAVVDRALKADKSERLSGARELAEEVESWLTGGRVGSYAYSARELIGRWVKKHRAILGVSALALVALIGLGVSSYVTILGERDRAQAAEAEARAALEAAVRSEAAERAARGRSDAIIQFMLTDLHDKLEPVGKLDLLDSVLGTVQEHYALAGTEDPRAQHNHARSLVLDGKIAGARGEFDAAAASTREAIAIHRALIAAHPEEALYLDGLAEDLYRLGRVHRAQGQEELAHTTFEAALAEEQRLQERDLDDPEHLLDLSKVYVQLAEGGVVSGDLTAAQAALTTALQQRKRLNARDPDQLEWLAYTASAEERLGEVILDQGQLSEAEDHFLAALAIRERLSAAKPDHADWTFALANLHQSLALIHEQRRAFEDALAASEQAVELTRPLARRDPSNTSWSFALAKRLEATGQFRAELGQRDAARDDFKAAQRTIRGLLLLAPDNLNWQRELAVTHNLLGDLDLAADNLAAAQTAYQASLDIVSRLASEQPDNAELQRDLVVGLNKLGDLHVLREQTDPARDAYERALSITEALAQRDPTNAAWKRDLAVAYSRLGELEEGSRKRRAEARAYYAKAAQVLESLTQLEPDNAQWKDDLETTRARITGLDEERSSDTRIKQKNKKRSRRSDSRMKQKNKKKGRSRGSSSDILNGLDDF